jgi:hypothetical protein
VLTDEQIMGAMIVKQLTPEMGIDDETLDRLAAVLNSSIVGYDAEVSPEQNLYDLGLIEYDEHLYITADVEIEKNLYGAFTLALQTMVQIDEEGTCRTLSAVFRGLRRERLWPVLPDMEENLSEEEQEALVEMMRVSRACLTLPAATYYSLGYDDMEMPISFYDVNGVEHVYASNMAPLPARKLKALAQWLLNGRLYAPLTMADLSNYHSFIKELPEEEESLEEELYPQVSSSEEDELEDLDIEELSGHFWEYEDSSDDYVDTRMDPYPKRKMEWRKVIQLAPGRPKSRFQGPVNVLAGGGQKAVKKRFPMVGTLLSRVERTSKDTAMDAVGTYLTTGGPLIIPFVDAPRVMAHAAKEVDVTIKINGEKPTNHFETGQILFLIHPNCTWWQVDKGSSTVVFSAG